MRRRLPPPSTRLILFCLLLLTVAVVSTTTSLRNVLGAPQQGGQRRSVDGVWEEIDTKSLAATDKTQTTTSRSFRLDREELSRLLSRAPREVTGTAIQGDLMLSLPLPNGGYGRFVIEESGVLAPELAAQFPEIKSYRGRGVDDPSLWLRFDWTPSGFHANVTSSNGTFVIHPASSEDTTRYVAYSAEDDPAASEDLLCEVAEAEGRLGRGLSGRLTSGTNSISAQFSGPSLRTFRIAIATTQEYTNSFGGGTVAGTLASINTWLNGMNLIYERELAIRFVLVASNTTVIYTAEPDPFTNGNTGLMIEESRALLNTQIGISNYDVGHTLGAQAGSGASGRAYVGVVCDTSYKGGGATVIGQSIPVGNISVVGVLAHELGHELGASHSFNASCSGNRMPGGAWESGSGLTIMAYAGQCAPDAIVSGRAMHFHLGTIQEITAYINSDGNCAVLTSTSNNAPVVNGGLDYTIPRSTPFTLSAAATDADAGDQSNLTFSWEQIDSGGATYLSPPYSDAADSSSTTRPIFRPFSPTSSPSRTFPSLTYILNNANVPPATIGGLQTAENLPSIGRQLSFNCAVRDGRGGTSIDGLSLTIAASAGPFQMTQPNVGLTWEAGTVQTIAWTVNGTNLAPVSCSQVRLSLSIDGGQTFPTVLAASTPNDGSESVLMPANQVSATARIKVEAVNNIFFDVSDANFSLVPPNSCQAVAGLLQSIGSPGTDVNLTGVNFTGVTSVTFTGGVGATFNVTSSTALRATVPVGATTGPIRVSKTNCADAFSPSFIVSSTPPVGLAVDDGSFEGAYTGGGYAVNRLTPSAYPATLTSISIHFASFTGLQVGTAIDLLVGVNPDGDANIDNTSFQVTPATVQALNQFNVYSVPNLTINTGDLVVGFRYTVTSGVFPVVYDKTLPARGRSYGSGDGVFFVLQDTYGATFVGNAGIRASVYQGPQGPVCTPSISPTSSSFSSAGGNGAIVVTVAVGCSWTAVSNVGWAQITTGTGSGNGTASFVVTQNSGVARTGTMTVAGQTLTVRQGANFADVAPNSAFFEHIGKMSASGVTAGCGQDLQGNPLYCPSQLVSREQMAAFIVRALGDFNPQVPGQQHFVDVPPSNVFFSFIDQMAVRGITLGCNANGPLYCPSGNVTREQMAAFIIRALGQFNPPTPAQQRFADVPSSNAFYAFIDRMAVLGITLGCDPQGTLYCPGGSVTREQMAAFLVRAFGL